MAEASEIVEAVRRQRWGIVAVVAAGTLFTAAFLHGTRQDGPDLPIEQYQAEKLLYQAVRLAQAGDFAGLCQSVATTPGPCQFLLQSARDAGWEPGPDIPQVIGTTRRPGSLLLHLAGTRADGSSYTADFEVVHQGADLRARTPVYWSGVQVSQGECITSANQVECTGALPPPM